MEILEVSNQEDSHSFMKQAYTRVTRNLTERTKERNKGAIMRSQSVAEVGKAV